MYHRFQSNRQPSRRPQDASLRNITKVKDCIMDTTTDNYFGALIFWSYILAALGLTGLISRSLWSIHRTGTAAASQSVGRQGNVRLFSGLSVLSFSVLSYHMLYFLIDHYTAWTPIHDVKLPRGLEELLTRNTASTVWKWSHTSSLFQDFARELCEGPRHFWWTSQSLLFSFQWNILMAVQGEHQHSITWLSSLTQVCTCVGVRFDIPHRWSYFVLGQILPTSFAQNMFCTAISLSPMPRTRRSVPSPSRVQQALVVTLLYAALLIAPLSARTSFEIPMLLATRVLLATPYLLLATSTGSGKKEDKIGQQQQQGWYNPLDLSLYLILLGCTGFIPFQTWKAGDFASAVRSLNDSRAVSALGYDYLIGAASFGLFMNEARDLLVS